MHARFFSIVSLNFHPEGLHQAIVSEAPGQGWRGGVCCVHVSLRISSGAGDTQRKAQMQSLWTSELQIWEVRTGASNCLLKLPGQTCCDILMEFDLSMKFSLGTTISTTYRVCSSPSCSLLWDWQRPNTPCVRFLY